MRNDGQHWRTLGSVYLQNANKHWRERKFCRKAADGVFGTAGTKEDSRAWIRI
jgi:hypothetical protein